ncbi:hypothetical protein PG996_011857 [Apiospora saccharicola]|uniref:FHA domain-containing protein n=1 Tax=Apiospora saccharicola TaxID=335842 RepID=A0ABR1UIM7_9PEZI
MSPQSKDLKDSDLSGAPNSQTLFHLVPTTGSSLGYEAFRCPQNQPFLSESRQKDPSGRFQMGFEIGYHVPATARGRVITQLGRNADIDLPDGSMSRIRHAVFEFCPKTDGIFIRDRSGQKRSVACKPTNSAPPQDVAAEEKGLLRYGQSYKLKIGPYAFDLVWYITDEAEAKEVVQEGYERSNEEAALEPVCDHPTDYIEPDKICRYPPRVKMNIDFDFDLADILRESAILAQSKFAQVRSGIIPHPEGGKDICVAIKGLFPCARGSEESQESEIARAQIRNEAKILMPPKHVSSLYPVWFIPFH